MKLSMSLLKQKSLGFTLLELLVVVAILGLLAAYVGPRYFSQLGRSEAGVAKAQIDAFTKALDQYRLDTGDFPSNEQSLGVLFRQPDGVERWAGPYLRKEVPVDPWGRPYQYRYPGTEGRDYDVTSLGKDGAAGGVGDNADLSN